jgi:hypothetical protein
VRPETDYARRPLSVRTAFFADVARLGDHGCFCCGALRGEKTQWGGEVMGWKPYKRLIFSDFLNVRGEGLVCAVVWEVRQYTALQQTLWEGVMAVDA